MIQAILALISMPLGYFWKKGEFSLKMVLPLNSLSRKGSRNKATLSHRIQWNIFHFEKGSHPIWCNHYPFLVWSCSKSNTLIDSVRNNRYLKKETSIELGSANLYFRSTFFWKACDTWNKRYFGSNLPETGIIILRSSKNLDAGDSELWRTLHGNEASYRW